MKTMKKLPKNKRASINIIIILLLTAIFFSLFLSGKAFASPVNTAKLVELTNNERVNHGLKALTIDPALTYAATLKASDMINNHYFEHFSPSGKSPWDFIKSAKYYYEKAGENLAMDFRTSEGMHDAWMKSPTHRDNILNPSYENLAIVAVNGVIDNHTTTLVVQMFGKPNLSRFRSLDTLINSVSGYILGY